MGISFFVWVLIGGLVQGAVAAYGDYNEWHPLKSFGLTLAVCFTLVFAWEGVKYGYQMY